MHALSFKLVTKIFVALVYDIPCFYSIIGLSCEKDINECKISDSLCNNGICVNNYGKLRIISFSSNFKNFKRILFLRMNFGPELMWLFIIFRKLRLLLSSWIHRNSL